MNFKQLFSVIVSVQLTFVKYSTRAKFIAEVKNIQNLASIKNLVGSISLEFSTYNWEKYYNEK